MWWIRYSDGNGKIRREKAGTKSQAQKLYLKRKADVLAGRKLPENFRAAAPLFSELAASALEYSTSRKKTYRDDEIRMERILAHLRDRRADEITPHEIERLLNALTKTPATFNRYRALLSLTFRLAVDNRVLAYSPVRAVKQKRENNARDRFLSDEEEGRLRKAIQQFAPKSLSEFEFALHTGFRRSEQYGLRWSDVDLDRRIITVRESKHGFSRRIPINDLLLSLLKDLRSRKTSDYVFAHQNGSPKKTPREWFRKCLDEAKISDFTWHCLRHTFASRLVMAGADLRTVQQLMGHKTIQMTIRYSHLAPEHQLYAVQLLCRKQAGVAADD
jgi:integrase